MTTELLPHLRKARDLADRSYAQPLNVDELGGGGGHVEVLLHPLLHRPVRRDSDALLGRRRLERAQDLLRATNLTVTEVCHLVGYASLGTFSTRFREFVGVSPSDYQAQRGAARVPGCYVFMLGLQPIGSSNLEEAPDDRQPLA